MEPYDREELTEDELDRLLRTWTAPAAPAHMRRAVFPKRGGWWRRIWTASFRVPVPVAACVVAVLAAGAWWLARPAAPRVIVKTEIKTERVEVPVVREREVPKIIYRDRRAVAQSITFNDMQPVAELRPRIIRSEDAHN